MGLNQKTYENKPERSYIQRKPSLNTSGVQTEGRVLRGTTFF